MNEAKAIGIDFGSSKSCAAVFLNEKIQMIPDERGRFITSPHVSLSPQGDVIFAEDRRDIDIRNTVFDSKKLIGRKFHDKSLENEVKYWQFQVVPDGDDVPVFQVEISGCRKTLTAEQVLQFTLLELKHNAEKFLRSPVLDVVITVPANFGNNQLRAIKNVAGSVGFQNIRIINDTSALAIAYGLEAKTSSEKNILIFDLGAGSLSVSIAKLKAGGAVEVKSTAGNTHSEATADKLVFRIADHCAGQFKKRHNRDISEDKSAVFQLRCASDRAIRQLSTSHEAFIRVASLFEVMITKNQFEELCSDVFRAMMSIVEKVLYDAKMEKCQIDEIVLTGGGAHIPKIQTLLSEFFNGKKLITSLDPVFGVAHGAALTAAIFSNEKSGKHQDRLFIDVSPHSFGIETAGGVMTVVVERNVPLPYQKTVMFTTRTDDQSVALIKVLEGSSALAKDNNFLEAIELSEIVLKFGKTPKIEVTFNIDVNGILTVSVVGDEIGNCTKTTPKTAKLSESSCRNGEVMLYCQRERLNQSQVSSFYSYKPKKSLISFFADCIRKKI